jgi:hypothetical protein
VAEEFPQGCIVFLDELDSIMSSRSAWAGWVLDWGRVLRCAEDAVDALGCAEDVLRRLCGSVRVSVFERCASCE